MTTARESIWKESWEDFKKEITWDNMKILISAGLPVSLYLYGYTFWLHRITILFNSLDSNHETPDQALIQLCIICGMIAPLWLAIYICNLGLWIGKITGFYTDNRTRRIVFDEIEYSIRDMPQEQREQIKSVLSSYKSKVQIRRERKQNQSWLRRTFT